MEAFDYIVIGGGSAGCVMAARLSENPDCRVLLLEAGPTRPMLSTTVPGLLWSAIARHDWKLPSEPDESRDGATPPWIAGKLLGGGGAINGMMFVRGLAEDFDAWAAAGGEEWRYDALLPWFRAIERVTDPEPGPDRGRSGPVAVRTIQTLEPLTNAFLASADANGMTRVPDVNAIPRGIAGVGRGQTNQDRGRRASTVRAYLRPVRSRANLIVRGGAQVQRIRIENGRAVAVEYRMRGKARIAFAGAEVVLAAGAFGSPKLLMLSGIGAADALARHGIATHADLPGVGANLMDHPMLVARPDVTVPTYNAMAGPMATARAGLEWLVRGTGLATVTLGHAIGYARSIPDEPVPDLFLAFSPLAYDVTASGLDLPKQPRITLGVGLCRPFVRGRVSLRSGDPVAPPRIELSYLKDVRDQERLRRGYALMEALLSTAPLADLLAAPMTRQTPDLASETFSMYHPCGTCGMGPDHDPLAVVDGQLRVRGVDGLRVADASIMPLITSGNIHAPVIMIAEKAAAMIAGHSA